jgi:two-component system chemotaxis response regulator CheB
LTLDTPRRGGLPAASAAGAPRESSGAGRRTSAPPAAALAKKTVCIGASTGGTVALELILRVLPLSAPPIAIVQHMPARFTHAFAARVNGLSAIEVVEATDGLVLRSGLAAIAPGDRHIVVERRGGQCRLRLVDTPPLRRHKPAVDVLFHSAAEVLGADGLGVLLTGMGADGADGLGAMKAAGAITVAQDEATCVVFGMPRVAIERGAARAVLPLDAIAKFLAGPSS